MLLKNKKANTQKKTQPLGVTSENSLCHWFLRLERTGFVFA